MKEVQIKPDVSGKNSMRLNVNGKRLRFNKSAVDQLGLSGHVNLSLASFEDDENAKPDKLIIRTNGAAATKRNLQSLKSKWRDLTSEEVLRATGLENGDYAIEYDEQNKVHYVNFTPGASRSNFDKAATKQRNKDIAADIKAKQAQKSGDESKKIGEVKAGTKRV